MERRVPAATLMQCFTCHTGTLKPGKATVVSERDGHVAVVRDVPGLVCDQCGEEFFDAEVAQAVYDQSERIFAKGLDVEIARYAA